MTDKETRYFKLIDDFARTMHNCFLAEFFPKGGGGDSYLCCFRPVGKPSGLLDRNPCKYVTIDAEAMQGVISNECLPSTLEQFLIDELSNLLRAKS